ncbi:MAG TPA: MFS transporter [Rhizomicrobium sp.]|jgi:MFS family permease|nr:MFS transporter [Rhizomicrobium sp.]
MRAAVRSVLAVIIAIFLVQAANALQTSLLSLRAGMAGFSAVTIGIVMASYYVGYSLAPLTSHAVVGRLGHVRTMALGALAAAAVIALHPLLIGPVAWSLLRLTSGFVLSSLYISAESWIHARAANEERGRVFSVYMVVQMIAMTGAQFLVTAADPRTVLPFLIASALFVAGSMPVVIARHTAPHRVPPEPFNIWRLFVVAPLGSIATVVGGVTWSIMFTFGPVYATGSGLSIAQEGIFMAAAMAGGALLQFPLGWLSDRIGRRPAIALMSAAGIAVGAFGAVVDGQGAMLEFAASALAGAAIFPMYAISAAHTNDAVAPQNRVAAAAGLVLLFGLGSIAGPLISGGAVTALGSSGYYIVLAIASALSLAAAAIAR